MKVETDNSTIIFALHGFLGRAQDWNLVKEQAEEAGKKYQWIVPDLFSDNAVSLADFHSCIQSLVEKYDLKNRLKNRSNQKIIFLGYSLGGRIGLQFLEEYPDLFEHFIFISTHPGLKTVEEKADRLIQDQTWAKKLINDSWDSFIKDWNDQPVLKNSSFANANLKDNKLSLSKDRLVEGLLNLSLARQKNHEDTIFNVIAKNNHSKKITWVVGSEDNKFKELALTLQRNLESRFESQFGEKKIPLDFERIVSGHRVHLENPQELLKIIQ